MKPADAAVVIVSDNADDAHQPALQLRRDFTNVRICLCDNGGSDDLDGLAPDVLVLAFDTVVKAERFYLGLYRRGSPAVRRGHRAIVLCAKEEVTEVFELCKAERFDDYVPFWPHSFDGKRLPMTVWNACRSLPAVPDEMPPRAALFSHAQHLAALERAVEGVRTSPDPGERGLGDRIRPAVEGTREIAAAIRRIRPLLLVVDDDEMSSQLIAQAIDAERWQVEFAVDAATALARLRSVIPDLVLMDIHLPGIDGLELTRRLKASAATSRIPVLMLTGDSRLETLRESIQAGAADFLVKPVSRAHLEGKLDKILPR